LAQVGVGCCCTSTAMAQQSSDLKFSFAGNGDGMIYVLRDLTVKITYANGFTEERTRKAGDLVIAGLRLIIGLWKFETDAEVVQINWNGSQWTGLDVKSKAVLAPPAQLPQDSQRKAQVQQVKSKISMMKLIPANRWGITGKQLMALADQVVQKFTGRDENPNVYEVVDKLIKPLCKESGVSYALLLNPKGIKCSTFVTHAWFESFLAFVDDIRDHYPDFETRVFWICFTANPQTWSPAELSDLLGPSALQSPFAIAIQQCDTFLIVRNRSKNLYSRLWCVAELVLVNAYGDCVVEVIGNMPPRAQERGGDIGLNATCSSPEDVEMLRATIEVTGLDANSLVAEAIRARPGTVLRSA